MNLKLLQIKCRTRILQQAVGNYELKTSEGTSTHLVGVKDNQGEVLAACLLTSEEV